MKRRELFRIRYSSGSFSSMVFIIVVGLSIIGIIIYITESMRSILLEHNRRVMRSYARLWMLAMTEAVRSDELNIIFEEIIKKADFPIIQTNADGEPIAWRNIDTDDKNKIKKILKRIAKRSEPIPVRSEQTGLILGYLYFGETPFVAMLRYIPIGEFLLMVLFFYLLLLEAERRKSRELQNIWLGMARETAHQLGTPISALFGWIELIRDKCIKSESEKELDNLVGILNEMENDIRNLDNIVKRFGKIGSAPEYELVNVNEVVREAVEYFRKRTPTIHGRLEIEERYNDGVLTVFGNRLLLGWAVENLIKNSIEALDRGTGKIIIVTRFNQSLNTVDIVISDNGHGIPGSIQRKIFLPGFTTKKRGWGLGLSLAKRIVEEYHYGKLELVESKPYERTTFAIYLPLTVAELKRGGNK